MAKISSDPGYFSPTFPAIVCDNGSYSLKAGFSGDDFPRAIIPTIIGTPRKDISDISLNIPGYGQRVSYAGQFALDNRGILDISCPIRNGIISDWDAMEQIWYHMYYEDLLVPPENFNILHTESVQNSTSCREKLIEIMFELFNVPSTTMVPKSVLPLYSNGKTTGLVVDSGYDDTQVVPVYEGYPLKHAIRNLPLGGWHITKYLMQLMNDRGYNFTTPNDWDITREIKEQFCYCALDFHKELTMFSRDMEQQYTLPDGLIVRVNNEAFRSTELLFDPSLFGIESEGGIHDVVFKACRATNIEDEAYMYKNIVLAGGNSLFPFLSDRLKNMLAKFFEYIPSIEISARPERKYSTWIGGSILASTPIFEQMWIKKTEYDEEGPRVVHHKCFN